MVDSKLPISAMVVGYNEGHHLDACLESVSFCGEIIYIDLGSTDSSVLIASKFTDRILYRERANYPSGEYVHAEVVHQLINDWVILMDPDERIDPSLIKSLREIFPFVQKSGSVGGVMVPWVFYFKNRRLKGTVWGMNNKRYLLVNKHRFDFFPMTHYGRRLNDSFESTEIIEAADGNIIHHYWVTSIRGFIEKHQRYLRKEGMDQYKLGYRVSKKNVLLTPLREFSHSFITCKGYKNGLLGAFLSLFWAFYKTYSTIDLLIIQEKKSRRRKRKVLY